MATDAEESETEEQERPAPAKRSRKANNTSINFNFNFRGLDQQRNETVEETENADGRGETDPNQDHDWERRTRERLKKWQACQVAKGFVDNTINRVLENYVLPPPASYALLPLSLEESRSRLFGGMSSGVNEMEDRAVAMAIRNHGLVQTQPYSHPQQSDRCIGEESCDFSLNLDCKLDEEAVPATSKGIPNVGDDEEEEEEDEEEDERGEGVWGGEKADDSSQQQDFLERAVAEAIKKKGLSALSVDYG